MGLGMRRQAFAPQEPVSELMALVSPLGLGTRLPSPSEESPQGGEECAVRP